MKKRYIWQNTNLSIEDWRDGYIECCEMNGKQPGGDDDLFNWMIDTNYSYLDDEFSNLDKRIDEQILVIADLGLWNGRRAGYKIIKSRNLKDILAFENGFFEVYGDGKNIKAREIHHDGTNNYLFRAIRPGRDIDKLLTAIYNDEQITGATLNYYTRSIYKDIASIYGW